MRIGIDLGGSKIAGVALGPDGTELARARTATPPHDYDGTVRAVADLVGGLEAQLNHRAPAVGVGIPGTLSPATGLVKNANSTWMIGRPFDRDLAAALGRPVRVANDANCFALSEAIDGAGGGAAIVFGVILGTGVGAGIVVERRVLTGANAIAGEWGHNPLPRMRDEERPGAPCFCGRRGCIETFLSGPALARDHATRTGRKLEPAEVFAAAESGDRHAAATVARYEERLARALAHVVNIVDPDVIVLGGGLSNARCLYEHVPALMGPKVFSDTVATRILPPRHGDDSGVRGAAWLWPADDESGVAP